MKSGFCAADCSSHYVAAQLPGGAAVRSNLEEFSKLTEEKEQEAEKCKRIYNLADPELQLALKARKDGGLKTNDTI